MQRCCGGSPIHVVHLGRPSQSPPSSCSAEQPARLSSIQGIALGWTCPNRALDLSPKPELSPQGVDALTYTLQQGRVPGEKKHLKSQEQALTSSSELMEAASEELDEERPACGARSRVQAGGCGGTGSAAPVCASPGSLATP